MTRPLRRRLGHYSSVATILATIQISGQCLNSATAFGPSTRGLAVRPPLLNMRPDGTDVPNDDNPFLHPMRYVEALLFKPATVKRSEATSFSTPAEPALLVSTFAGGDNSWSSPVPSQVTSATIGAPAPPSGGNFVNSLGGGAHIQKRPARGKPTFATKTMGGYLDHMSSATVSTSWSAPVPPAVAPATLSAPAPPGGGDYLTFLGGGAPVKRVPTRGKPKAATKTMGGYLDNMSSATPSSSTASPFSRSSMSPISNANSGGLKSKGSDAAPNSAVLADGSQPQPSSSSTQQTSRQESSSTRGTHDDDTAPSSSVSYKEDAWKFEGFGNIGRGPGSSRRVRNRVAQWTASSNQQQPSPSHESQVPPTDPIGELIGRIRTELELAREFFSNNEIQPAPNPIPPAPVANIVGSSASDSSAFVLKDVVVDATPATANTPAPAAVGDYLSSLGSGAPAKKAPARGKPKAAAKTMGGYLDNMSSATPASSWSKPLPATVSAAATPAGDDSATIEVMEGLMTELDLARDFGDRATREVIERLKTELDLARAFFSHNERK